jgi:hypothetical protein
MQFQIMTDKDKVTVYADVTKIEVEDVVGPGEDSFDESYTRTIRFTGYDGEAIEVFCTAFEEKVLWLNRVRELKPVEKPEEVNWLEPKVYKGNSEKTTEQESD